MPPRNWRLRIEDILESIGKISRYTKGMNFDTFAQNEMAIDAVVRNFSIIGEAARHVPEQIQMRCPELPWEDMCAMRNVLVHQYFGADLKTIWETIRHDFPPLTPSYSGFLTKTRDLPGGEQIERMIRAALRLRFKTFLTERCILPRRLAPCCRPVSKRPSLPRLRQVNMTLSKR